MNTPETTSCSRATSPRMRLDLPCLFLDSNIRVSHCFNPLHAMIYSMYIPNEYHRIINPAWPEMPGMSQWTKIHYTQEAFETNQLLHIRSNWKKPAVANKKDVPTLCGALFLFAVESHPSSVPAHRTCSQTNCCNHHGSCGLLCQHGSEVSLFSVILNLYSLRCWWMASESDNLSCRALWSIRSRLYVPSLAEFLKPYATPIRYLQCWSMNWFPTGRPLSL